MMGWWHVEQSCIGIAAVGIVVVAVGLILWQQRSPATFPADFPYTWLAAGVTTTDAALVQVLPGTTPEQAPQADGKRLYPAYVCTAPDCPGRTADGKPQLFPFALHTIPGVAFASCPVCAKRADTAPVMPGDPALMRPYLTAEGERIMRRFAGAAPAGR